MNSYRHLLGQAFSAPVTARSKMSDLITGSAPALLIITRFGIPLGFGDKSIGLLCKEHGVDTHTLLLLVNSSILEGYEPTSEQIASIHLDSLITYLLNSHAYFLDFRLPLIRQRLLSAISNCPQELAYVIRRFFDEYVEEVHKHMNYEDRTVFPYARRLASGERDGHYNIGIFSKRHDQIELKITELKNLLIKYYTAPSGYELTAVLHDIFSVEIDLAAHNYIEDSIFTPYIQYLESKTK
ncbi:hemerythrin domain-containing protein [uncultured Porphyromonas sp.]|jgi:hypothetical protein|uniref:hemerythrin domain-containing protein n=1 Tax=uncultured Porphyromonas sp. TaxID=159274 RepID=UPI0026137233|nr:hemerythrin domain-containing protein [uncultured Porphyromonas sp.]